MKTTLDLALLCGFKKKYLLDTFVNDPSNAVLVARISTVVFHAKSNHDKSIREGVDLLFKQFEFNIDEFEASVEKKRAIVYERQRMEAAEARVRLERQTKRQLDQTYYPQPTKRLNFTPAVVPLHSDPIETPPQSPLQCRECPIKDKRINEMEQELAAYKVEVDDLNSQIKGYIQEIEQLRNDMKLRIENNDDLAGQVALLEYEKIEQKQLEYRLRGDLAKLKLKK